MDNLPHLLRKSSNVPLNRVRQEWQKEVARRLQTAGYKWGGRRIADPILTMERRDTPHGWCNLPYDEAGNTVDPDTHYQRKLIHRFGSIYTEVIMERNRNWARIGYEFRAPVRHREQALGGEFGIGVLSISYPNMASQYEYREMAGSFYFDKPPKTSRMTGEQLIRSGRVAVQHHRITEHILRDCRKRQTEHLVMVPGGLGAFMRKLKLDPRMPMNREEDGTTPFDIYIRRRCVGVTFQAIKEFQENFPDSHLTVHICLPSEESTSESKANIDA